MGDKERRIAGAERATVGKVCVLNPFLSWSRLDNFSVSGEFCVSRQWKQTQLTHFFGSVLYLLYLYVCLICASSNLFAFFAFAGALQDNLVSWAQLMMLIGHRKSLWNWRFERIPLVRVNWRMLDCLKFKKGISFKYFILYHQSF